MNDYLIEYRNNLKEEWETFINHYEINRVSISIIFLNFFLSSKASHSIFHNLLCLTKFAAVIVKFRSDSSKFSLIFSILQIVKLKAICPTFFAILLLIHFTLYRKTALISLCFYSPIKNLSKYIGSHRNLHLIIYNLILKILKS